MDTPLLQYAVGSPDVAAMYARADLAPAAVWDFDTGFKTHSWSFARASDASYFDQGVLVVKGENIARMVAAGSGRALLIEPAAANTCNLADYTLVNLTSMIAGPTLGGVATTRLTGDDGLGYLQYDSCSIAGLSAGAGVVFSCLLHASSTSKVQLWVGIGPTGVGRARASYDLTDQTATLIGNQDGVFAQARLEAIGNGLFRASLTSQVIAASDELELCRITGIHGSVDFALPQFETGAVATSSIAPPATERAPDLLMLDVPPGHFMAVIADGSGAETTQSVSLPGGAWQPITGPKEVSRIMLYPA